MKKFAYILLITMVGLLLHSCVSAQEDKQTQRPAPAKVLGGIAVYDEFASAEPLFHQQNDTTYVINFWATWCKPCVEELPYFEQLTEHFKDQKVKVILLSLDFPRQLESKLLPFVAKNQLKSEVIALTDIDFNSWIDKISPQWSGAIPVTLVYNAQKRHFVEDQFPSYAALETIVKAFLE